MNLERCLRTYINIILTTAINLQNVREFELDLSTPAQINTNTRAVFQFNMTRAANIGVIHRTR